MGENSEKYITFSVPFKKDFENWKIIKYKLKFIDSFRLMATSLSNLTNNLSDQLYNNCIGCNNLLDSIIIKDDKIVFSCFSCKKNITKDFKNGLLERFKKTYQFCENDNNKFLLLLRKGVYPYEYMDSWDKFNEANVPN